MPAYYLNTAILLGIIGLLVGSFLNVVIHRLPRMLELRWAAECAEIASQSNTESANLSALSAPFNLWTPRSRCVHCGHQIRWFENIPLLSYLALRGKCGHCHTPIGWRYPAVEFICAALFAYCGWTWGMGAQAWAWSGFCAALLALAWIDWDTTLLPDDLTLPLIWAGLCAAALGWVTTELTAALWGAVVGYLSLWLIYWAFKLTTGKEGMGYGDFKLFAALGAWLGWQALIPIILMASVIGALVGLGMRARAQLREGGYVPFGPFLALAGLSAMMFGPALMLDIVGL